MNTKHRGALYLASSAFMWGVNFHLLKTMLSSVHFVEAGFWRYLFGVAALALFVRKPGLAWQSIKRNPRGILVVGFLGLFCFNLLLFMGLNYTSSINAALIISLNPLVTLLLAYLFLGTRISFTQLVGACLGIVGVAYLLCRGDFSGIAAFAFSRGDVLVLMAMVLSAIYPIWVRKYSANLSNGHFTFFTNLVCFLSFVVVLPFFMRFQTPDYSIGFWAAAFAFGALGTALTYVLWNKGVGIAGAARAGIFMNIVPFSTALVAAVLGVELEGFHAVAGILIIAGLLLSQWKKH